MTPENEQLLVEEIAPRIRSQAHSFVPVGSDDREEQCQDAVAIAAQLLHSVEARAKAGVSASNIAYFAIKSVKQGRRSYGSKPDPLHPVAILSGRSRVVSLQESVRYEEGSDEPLVLGEVLECEAEDPSATGARNLDWQAFAATLDELAQAILEYLADGRPLRELAQVVGMSRSGIQRHKNRLTEAVQAFMGPELMQELQRPPQWRINIRATRERLACRYARSLA
jgi:DNA-directed RNA polymerase specialized sigma24 family protein